MVPFSFKQNIYTISFHQIKTKSLLLYTIGACVALPLACALPAPPHAIPHCDDGGILKISQLLRVGEILQKKKKLAARKKPENNSQKF